MPLVDLTARPSYHCDPHYILPRVPVVAKGVVSAYSFPEWNVLKVVSQLLDYEPTQ